METTEPASIRADLLLSSEDETEAGQVAPPVVAIVVADDHTGPWLEETLAALAAQDYDALSVLVLVDPAATDPKPRIAAAHPRAFVRTLEGQPAGTFSFGGAANEALTAVEGAPFLLFCHDDVVADPDAVRLMVEEAYRSNAGVVGPKLVDEVHPEVLLEVGMTVDHYGVPFSGIEPGEVDQEQHDAVRDVFFVSNAMMLVRSDLFHELGGFDTETSPGADDVDLCWRARLAGARIVVTPAARARHRCASKGEARATGDKEPSDYRAETRARVRMLCKSYSVVALVWVLPCALILSLAEAVGLLLTGRPRRAGALLAGWPAAFAHPGELRRARAAAQGLRTVDDSDVRDLMIHGSARARTYFTHRVHAGEKIVVVGARTRERVTEASQQVKRAPAIVGAVLAVLVLFGSRALLLARVPEVSGFRAWPGIASAWSTLTGAWRTTFMGAGVAATPAFGLMAALDTVLLGHAGLARSLVVGGALPLGAWGAYRLMRSIEISTLAAVGAAVAYGANPIARNAVWQGELGPLVCFALAPFAFAALVRAATDTGPNRGRARLHGVLTLALLVAVSAAVWPPGLGLVLVFAIAFFVAVPFTQESAFAIRALGRAALATAIAVVLCSPWVWSLLGADAATLGFQPRPPLSFAHMLSFHTSRAGAGIAPWGILAAAFVPLAIASDTRLKWAMRAWTLAVLSFALAWLPGRLWPTAALPAPDGLLVGAALGLAVAAGIGVAAVFDDLRQWHFGWRQVIPVVTGAGLLIAMFGLAADTPSGRWGLGAGDWARTYSWMGDNPPPGGFRVLWLGDPTVVPADAKVAGDTGFAVTRDGPGDARVLWAAPEQGADRVLADAIASAEAGRTSRLGHLIAPAGVRYVAFVRRAAPGDGAMGTPNGRLEAALAHQLDLELSRVDESGVVYQNDAWIPAHALVPPGAANVRAGDADPMDSAMRTEADGVQGVRASGGRTEPTGPGTLLWSEAADNGWHASSAGHAAARTNAFGWTNAFALDAHAPVSVHYDGGALPTLLHVLEVLAWILAIAAWVITRKKRAKEAA